ncbi:Serine/threonine-protein kinase mos, partial [Toxocara canis]
TESRIAAASQLWGWCLAADERRIDRRQYAFHVMDRNMCLSLSPFEKDPSHSSVVMSLCSPPSLHCSLSCLSQSSESSTSSLTPTVEFVASSQCRALILSPVRAANILAERKRLYRPEEDISITKASFVSLRRARRQLATEGTPTRLDLNGNVQLGEGGFGTVFRSLYNNHEVAIKQFNQRRHSPSSDFASLCAELNAFRLPPSPYVVPILSFTSSGISIQIVSELVHGRDLKKMLEDESWKPTSSDRLRIAFQIVSELVHGRDLKKMLEDESWKPTSSDRLRIAFQVISALWHCHSNFVLHLDLKPANVVMSNDRLVCKLSDFGCSRSATLSENGILVANCAKCCENFGTVAYKAPELLKVSTSLGSNQHEAGSEL